MAIGDANGIHFSSKPLIVDLEQVLAARLKCDPDSALTQSPVAAVIVGELLGRGSEIINVVTKRTRAQADNDVEVEPVAGFSDPRGS